MAKLAVSFDLGGEQLCGDGERRRRGRARRRAGAGKEKGDCGVVFQIGPRSFCNLCLAPSTCKWLDCGFDFRFLEGFFCKTVTDASRRSSDGRRTARIDPVL